MVEDGEKALHAWKNEHFALLLTDCHMPKLDGYTLTQTLRAEGVEAPIIGVTADTSEEASARMEAAGMNGMLFKPYSLESLRQMLTRWLPAAPAVATSLSEPDTVSTLGERWQGLFGDLETAKSMASEYIASNRKDCKDMEEAIAAGDSEELVEVAHRIKGAARMVGEVLLAAQAAKLESAARLKQLNELEHLGQGVSELMNDVEHKMGLWLHE